jgi:GNAT superfamily N-acetyltransferase
MKEFMDITIAKAKMDDASEILELQRIAYQREAALYNDWAIPPLTQTLPEIQAEFKDIFFLKALLSSRIIGSVRALLDDGSCKIGRLIVHPDHQKKGIGSLLMKKIESSFPDVKRFELFTGAKSIENIRLYKKLGYEEYEEQNLSPRVQIVLMEKITN